MPDGVTAGYQYNQLHQLTSIENRGPSDNLISRHLFTYNDHDLIASEEITGLPPVSGGAAREMQTFSYNQVNQLLSSTNPDRLFSYDADGNMIQSYTPEGYRFTAQYDAENRLTSIEYTDNAAVVHKRSIPTAGTAF